MSFQPIKKLLPDALKNHGISKQIQARQVLELARETLRALWGEERSCYLEPISLLEGTLKMASTSAVAMQRFRLDETRFMNEINRRLGIRVVHRIEVRSKGF